MASDEQTINLSSKQWHLASEQNHLSSKQWHLSSEQRHLSSKQWHLFEEKAPPQPSPKGREQRKEKLNEHNINLINTKFYD
jgi:hypothetical protein